MKSTPFMEIDDKGGEIVQRYESLRERLRWRSSYLDMDMDKEGSTLKNREGSKFLDKRSTQVGGASSWTFIGCIWYVHIHVLACIA
jgi:hypothetical protein